MLDVQLSLLRYEIRNVVMIAVDVWHCGLLEDTVRSNTSDFYTGGFSLVYLTRSPYQSSLYPVTSQTCVSLTEAIAPAGFALWGSHLIYDI